MAATKREQKRPSSAASPPESKRANSAFPVARVIVAITNGGGVHPEPAIRASSGRQDQKLSQPATKGGSNTVQLASA